MIKCFPALASVFISTFVLSTVSLSAKADLLDVNISNDAVSASYLADMGQGFFAGGSALHEEDTGQVVSLDILARDDLRSGEHTFSAGVGGRIFGILTEVDDNDGASLALGGFVNYNLPAMKAISINSEIYYGPSVTSTNELESVLYLTAGVELEVIERAKLHATYRKIRAKFEQIGSGDMDKGVHLGIKLEF